MANASLSPERLWALIIGIDIYQSNQVHNLSGAVNDSHSFFQYFIGLGVPHDHIRHLTNQAATRDGIIRELTSLGNNDLIRYGDPIFIFYAGHGSRAEPPSGWAAPKIELLVPSDCDLGPTNPGIPDRQFGKFLGDIAQRKGNNITLVLDCCHSASASRDGAFQNQGQARSTNVRVDYQIHQQICDSIMMTHETYGSLVLDRGMRPATGFTHAAFNSHILLAACKSTELARECNGQGKFSKALLDLLQEKGFSNLKYSNILENIGPLGPDQTPQCIGNNLNRLIFSSLNHSSSPPKTRKLFQYRVDNGKIFLKAGTAHEVCTGDHFNIFARKDDITASGILVVTEAKAFESYMYYPSGGSQFTLPQLGFAEANTENEASRKSLCIFVGLDPRRYLASVVQDPRGDLKNIQNARIKIELDMIDNRTEFHVVEPRPVLAGYNLPPLRSNPNPSRDEIIQILKSMEHYHRQLSRTTGDVALLQNVSVEFHRLGKRGDGFYHPMGPNLYDSASKQIELTAQPGLMYGIKLINHSKSFDLFPNVFYFNGSNFAIEPCFQHPTGKSLWNAVASKVLKQPVESFLPQGGVLYIGYGNGGVAPLECSLPSDRDVDVGYLKIFIFSEPVDQEEIVQHSIFHPWSSPPLTRPHTVGPSSSRTAPRYPNTPSRGRQSESALDIMTHRFSDTLVRQIPLLNSAHQTLNTIITQWPSTSIGDVAAQGRGVRPYTRQTQVWNAINIPIIQRRHGVTAYPFNSPRKVAYPPRELSHPPQEPEQLSRELLHPPQEPPHLSRGVTHCSEQPVMYPPADFSPLAPAKYHRNS